MLDEVGTCGAVLLDVTRWANVVRGDAIAKDAERTCTVNLSDVTRCHAEALEERRLLDVGAVAVPLINMAGAALHAVPLRILIGKTRVETLEHIRSQAGSHGLGDLLARGPNIAEIDRGSGVVVAQWLSS